MTDPEQNAVTVVRHDDGSWTVTPRGGQPEKHPDCHSAIEAVKRHHRRLPLEPESDRFFGGGRDDGVRRAVERTALHQPTGRCINLATERQREIAVAPHHPEGEPAHWLIQWAFPTVPLAILAGVLWLIFF